eukprot:CAMPEP_0185269810 /NCGR_PEP_ID=MMETSP1359-20130426/40822_1 /TAXON_ID=552665 /ORGANISM="Bigelowiella longifila, Strain CCMP242" /LENGTH=127 /DNA_ID=CAMNT_0027861139 /DNA_START=181 /DNA_END=561 /DNA_ORIENTATION=-
MTCAIAHELSQKACGLLEQQRWSSIFPDPAPFHHKHPVKPLDVLKPVADDEHCAAQREQDFMNLEVGREVHIRCRLIAYEKPRGVRQSPGQANELLLPFGKICPTLGNPGVESSWQRPHGICNPYLA